MNHETVFTLAGALATLGWLALVGALFLPGSHARRALLLQVGGRVLPLVLAGIYIVALVASWGDAPGGNFNSLAGVSVLFAVPGILLAGWVHYLAFDLFIGRWIVDDATARQLRPLLVLPCLFFTFMVGPLGLALYFALRHVATRPRASTA